MNFQNPRFQREFKTLRLMTEIHCRSMHPERECPCEECAAFLEYAHYRLEKCTFGSEKPACAKCPIHCYKPVEREKARSIMKEAGPKMLWTHPLLALWHFWDDFRSEIRVARWRKARGKR